MSDPLLDDLPVLRELGEQLSDYFHAQERAGYHRTTARGGAIRRRAVASSAAVAACLLAVIMLLATDGSHPSRARVALTRVADVASQQPEQFPTNQQYFYVRSQVVYLTAVRRQSTGFISRAQGSLPKARVTETFQTWSSASHRGIQRTHVVSVTFASSRARRLWRALGSPSLTQTAPVSGIAPPKKPTYQLGDISLRRSELFATSRNPAVLYRLLLKAGGSPAEVFVQVADTLAARPLPSALRAALYQTLLRVPHVTFIGSARGVDGDRTTIGLRLNDGSRFDLIFDPTTSELMATEVVALGRDARRLDVPSGTVLSRMQFLQRGVTNSDREPPRG